MAKTPDPIGVEINLADLGLNPAVPGAISYNTGDFIALDQAGLFNLRQGAATGVQYIDYLLENEPYAETGANDATYTATYTGQQPTKEEWFRNDATLIKSIDYTWTGNNITTEVRKVFAANGTTIVAQQTLTYVYTGSRLNSATMIRNV